MQVDMDIDESRDAEMEPLSPDVALAHRLTNRLRKERDDALRHYDFLKMEMKFKVESLEKELRDTEAYAKSLENRTPIPSNEYSSTSLYPFRQAALVSSLVLHHIQGEMQWQQDELMSTGESLLTTEWKLRQAEGRLQSKDGALETLQKDNASLQEQLDATEEELSASRNQVRDLTSRIASLEQMTEREKRSHEDIGSSLATVEAELEDVSRNLANAESSRDSLALQVTHLEQDLEKTQAELHHAEARYSELQAQQLSTMSSSGVTRSLRDQILELEQRILRRTEQIGLHQHDIKRLEANLRLQEDRVTEMTAELEVADREREAMIEDCESTREQRNETLKKCEELEESLEAMEGRVGQLEGQRDLEVQSLVEVIMKGASMRRTASKAMLSSLSRHAQAESQAQSHLHAVDSSSSETHSEIKRLQEIVEEKNCALQALESERDKAVANARTASESLQTAHVNSRATTTRFDDLRDENSSLQKEIAHLRTDLQSKENELFSLQQEYESWKLRDAERKADDRSRFEVRIEKLEEECKTLHETYGDLERRHAETSEELKRANEQVDEYVLSTSKRDTLERELRNDSETLRQRYEQETKQLQDELAIARADLEDAKQQHVDLENSHQETLEEISRAKEAIETQLKSATSRLNATLQAEGELGTVRAQYEEQVKDLEERLNMASNDVDSISQDRDQVQEKYEQSSQKLRDVEFQLTELRNRYDSGVKDLRERLAKASADLELALQGQSERDATLRSTIQRLEEEATVSSQKQVSLDAEVITLREQAAHLDTKLAALSGERETLSKEYDELKTQHERILQELSNSKANGDDHLVHLTQEVDSSAQI
ncbi:hypothetical protein QCA50_002223 [Cerrena zonata]|uniref:Uncharacterized protein n=1 Tax=Cerrena zonata TaxID=2478898 RepID=A0AAW0GYK2_9APHY